MHHHTLSNLSPIEMIIGFAALFLVLYIYFFPTITAIKRHSPHKTTVVILNLFFGFTLIGWIVALVLATKQPQQPQQVIIYTQAPPQHLQPPPR